MSKLPVTEIKDLATAVAKTAGAVDAILADGVTDFRDVPRIPALLAGLRGFAEVDFKEVLPEVADLDDAERVELADHFRAVFNIENDSIEAVIESGYEIVLAGLQAVASLRDVWSRIKGQVKAV